ncbi:MAG TPA: glutaminyl-peptide cyclotransferase [Desulfobacteria bacterium]|nr:glutaminyl-peptide cyclotransferase [Desulfobacteria bacterium]
MGTMRDDKKRGRVTVAMIVAVALVALLAGCVENEAPLPTPTPISTPMPTLTPNTLQVYSYEIVTTFPHDSNAFTQGLVFDNGFLYEGTGGRGESTVRKVELETGAVIKKYRLPSQYFGEGVTLWNDTLIQLTYQSGVGFVYDKDSFILQQEFAYPTDGWGLTHDGTHLIMSDGTATLYFLDPTTFEEVKRLEVHDNDTPVTHLNELEYIHGTVYANVWPTDRIVMISSETGRVVGRVDLDGLLSDEGSYQPIGVLNGIAYDAANDRLFITGKYWPKLFEIELVEVRLN